jgi:hypothetical protein
MYVAAATQSLFPMQEIPSRVVHIMVFSIPTFVLVYLVGRQARGPAAGVIALLILFASGPYLNHAFRVRLDAPLGGLSLLVLYCTHRALSGASAWRLSALIACAGLVAAAWTKYQFVCLPVAIAIHVALLRVRSAPDLPARRSGYLVGWVALSVLLAIASIAIYFVYVSDAFYVAAQLKENLSRFDADAQDWRHRVSAGREVVSRTRGFLGPPLILLAMLGVGLRRKEDGLSLLLGAFGFTTLLFSLASARLPGAGYYYWVSCVPALAVLAGGAGAAVLELAGKAPAITLLAVALVLQVMEDRNPSLQFAPPNPEKRLAEYIARHSAPEDAILAYTTVFEFYSGRVTGVIRHMSPDLLLSSLRGQTPYRVSHVVIRGELDEPPNRRLAEAWPEIMAAIQTRFRATDVGFDDVHVFEHAPPSQ